MLFLRETKLKVFVLFCGSESGKEKIMDQFVSLSKFVYKVYW